MLLSFHDQHKWSPATSDAEAAGGAPLHVLGWLLPSLLRRHQRVPQKNLDTQDRAGNLRVPRERVHAPQRGREQPWVLTTGTEAA